MQLATPQYYTEFPSKSDLKRLVGLLETPSYRLAGLWVYESAQHGKVRTEHVFDLTDGDGLALTSGESFRSLLELGESGVMVTKGRRGSRPRDPPRTWGSWFWGG